MELSSTFKFAPQTAASPTAAHPALIAQAPAVIAKSDLGPLAILLNDGDVDSLWKGGGFNVIWRPNHDPAAPDNDHFLELNMTHETMTFKRIAGPIPNRGLLQRDIHMFGINYIDEISDVNVKHADGSEVGLHFEPGIFAIVDATQNPLEPQTVVRMASIPHGTTIIAQGTIDQVPIAGPPQISSSNITPFIIGQPSTRVPFTQESMLANNSQFTTPVAQRSGVVQAMVDDPNSILRTKLNEVNVVETTTVRLSTTQTPIPGGGIANTAFLNGTPGPTPDSNSNARAAEATSTVWVMKVQPKTGGPAQTWLQYSQVVLLNFRGLSWPHVTVGTLVLDSPAKT